MKMDNVHGLMLNMIRQIYNETWNYIRINDSLTDRFKCNFGVLQGNTVSPTLFNEFINGLIQEVKRHNLGLQLPGLHMTILAYADDIVLLAPSEDKLQKLLDITEKWCSKWGVTINVQKTKVIHFRPKNTKRTANKFYLNQRTKVDIQDRYKYLGLVIHENLDLDKSLDELANAASRALGTIIGKTKDNYDLSFGCYSRLYDACVVPILCYGAGIWSCECELSQT